MSSFLSANMFLVFFVYGLAFFVTGVAVALESPRNSELRLARCLKYLSVFAILTGLAGWIDMVQSVPGLTPRLIPLPFHQIQPNNCFECHDGIAVPSAGAGALTDTLKLVLIVVPSLSLCQFGVRLWREEHDRTKWHLLPLWLLSLWLLAVVGFRAAVPLSSEEWLANAGILARYLLLLPASLLAAFGLMHERLRLRTMGVPQLARSCSWAAAFFVVSGMAGGLVVPPAPYPPADTLNYSTFFAATGLPVQVIRAVAAVAIAYFLVRVLRVFGVEFDRRLESVLDEERKAQQATLAAQESTRRSIEAWNRDLEERVSQRTIELEERNVELAALNSIAGAISQPLPLGEMLRSTLTKVLSLMRASSGAIYLLDSERQVLDLEVVVGADSWSERVGATVPLGRGFVGVAAQGRLTTVGPEETYGNDADCHGPTVGLPLVSRGRVQGVLALAAESSKGLSAQELETLQAIGGEVGIAIENARLQERLQNLAVLEERDRIAREMHDGVAQVLGYLNLRLRVAEGLLAQGDTNAVHSELAAAAAVTQDAYADVREAILGLRTSVKPEHGFVATLSDYLHSFRQQNRLPVELLVAGPGTFNLSAGAEIQVLRIIQEGLTNARKHAKAARAWVWLACSAQAAEITIGDDGRGFAVEDVAARAGHYGLQIMRERAESIGGSLHVRSAPGAGTTVLVTIPLTSEGGRPHGPHEDAIGGRSRSLP